MYEGYLMNYSAKDGSIIAGGISKKDIESIKVDTTTSDIL